MRRPARAVVFAYHNVGVRCLTVLLAAGVEVALVITHHDSDTESIWFDSVAALCEQHALAWTAPPHAGEPELQATIEALRPDFLFSFYYRHLLPAALLAVAPAFNMHGSLLPRFRGRAPVNWAVLHGASETGATLHEMTARPDAGAIVAQTAVAILPDDTAFDVFANVTLAAERTLRAVLPSLLAGTAPRRQNRLAEGSYFGTRTPADGRIDWRQPAQCIYNLHRAVAPPYPGAFTDVGVVRHVIHKARMRVATATGQAAAGLAPGLAVLGDEIVGVGGDGRLLDILELHAAGGIVTPAALRATLMEPR